LFDPTTAEALAAWKMAELCVSMDCNSVILEGDSMEVVQALRNDEVSWGRYSAVIHDAKILLCNVSQWRVCHVRRIGNMAAHKLAKLALSLGEERVWKEDYPMCVRQTVCDDVMSV
jgi:hypothetical protein